MISILVQMILKAPWKRKEGGKRFRFIGNTWEEVSNSDFNLITKSEAQVWLGLIHLLLDPECRSKYVFTSSNKDFILKVPMTFSYLTNS